MDPMNKEIRGKNIILREQRPEDAAFFARWFNEPRVMFQCGFTEPTDEERERARILTDHRSEKLPAGRLVQWKDHFRCGSHVFYLKDIDNMAMIKHNILLFTTGGEYYEIRCGKKSNLRKYLELWKQADASADPEHR